MSPCFLFGVTACGSGTHAPAPSIPANLPSEAVVVEQRGYLVAFPLDGSKSRRLAKLPGQAAAVSPDGSRVVFATGDWIDSNSHGISTMRIDGSDIGAVTRGNDGVPSWSADGRSLYFARVKTDTHGAYCGSIFSVATSGGNLHRITDTSKTGHDHQDPAVSPDGTRIAFSDWDACEGGTSSPRLEVVDLDGQPTGDLGKLARNGYYPNPEHSTPAWSPDGAQIAFRHNADLAVANRDGSNERILIRGGGALLYEAPAWSPDGRWIAFEREGGGECTGFLCSPPALVEVVHPDGSGRRVIARVKDPGWPLAGWVPRS
jgi:Tol biopolymer transport system component